MNRLLMLVPLALTSLGCHGAIGQPDRITIDSIIVEPSASNFVRTQAGRTRIGNQDLDDILEVDKGTHIRSHDIVVFHVLENDGSQDQQEFVGYLGPVTSGGPGECSIEDGSAIVKVYYGWVYVMGLAPAISSNRVYVGAEGSELILEIDSDVHRVYVLKTNGRPVHLTSFDAAGAVLDTKDWTLDEYYFAVDSTGLLNPIAFDASVQGFLDRVNAIVNAPY